MLLLLVSLFIKTGHILNINQAADLAIEQHVKYFDANNFLLLTSSLLRCVLIRVRAAFDYKIFLLASLPILTIVRSVLQLHNNFKYADSVGVTLTVIKEHLRDVITARLEGHWAKIALFQGIIPS